MCVGGRGGEGGTGERALEFDVAAVCDAITASLRS